MILSAPVCRIGQTGRWLEFSSSSIPACCLLGTDRCFLDLDESKQRQHRQRRARRPFGPELRVEGSRPTSANF